MSLVYQDYLVHYGVKGMKWGVRRKARGLINFFNGNRQAASALAVTIGAAAVAAHKSGVDKILLDYGKTAYSSAATNIKAQKIKSQFKASDWL